MKVKERKVAAVRVAAGVYSSYARAISRLRARKERVTPREMGREFVSATYTAE